MAVMHRGSSKFNIVLNGGAGAMLGDHGVMYVSSHRSRRGLHSHTHNYRQVPATLTGPGQCISHIPGRVFQKLVTCLSKQSPLHDDWRMVADKAFEFSQEDIDSLADQYPKRPMEGVLRKMIERQITVGRLVTILCEIQRLDAVTILTDAGYPRDLVPTTSTQEERTDLHEKPTTSTDGEPPDCTSPLVIYRELEPLVHETPTSPLVIYRELEPLMHVTPP